MSGVTLGRDGCVLYTPPLDLLDLPSSGLTARDAYCTVDEGGRKKRAIPGTYQWFYIPHPPLDFAALVDFLLEAHERNNVSSRGVVKKKGKCA
jgi:hypothetical protein